MQGGCFSGGVFHSCARVLTLFFWPDCSGVPSTESTLGAVALVSIVSMYSPLGSHLVLLRYVSSAPGSFAAYWGNVLITTLLLGGALTAALSWAGPHIAHTYSWTIVLFIALGDCICTQLTLAASNVFLALEKMRLSASLNVLVNLLRAMAAGSMFCSGCIAQRLKAMGAGSAPGFFVCDHRCGRVGNHDSWQAGVFRTPLERAGRRGDRLCTSLFHRFNLRQRRQGPDGALRYECRQWHLCHGLPRNRRRLCATWLHSIGSVPADVPQRHGRRPHHGGLCGAYRQAHRADSSCDRIDFAGGRASDPVSSRQQFQ